MEEHKHLRHMRNALEFADLREGEQYEITVGGQIVNLTAHITAFWKKDPRSRAPMPTRSGSFLVRLSLRSLQAEEEPSAVGKRDALADCLIRAVLGLVAINHDLGTGR
jgi:hypothetical protein